MALAVLCMATGNATRAVDELTFVLHNNPANHTARRRCEKAYCEIRSWDKAKEDLEILRRNGEGRSVERLVRPMRAAGAPGR